MVDAVVKKWDRDEVINEAVDLLSKYEGNTGLCKAVLRYFQCDDDGNDFTVLTPAHDVERQLKKCSVALTGAIITNGDGQHTGVILKGCSKLTEGGVGRVEPQLQASGDRGAALANGIGTGNTVRQALCADVEEFPLTVITIPPEKRHLDAVRNSDSWAHFISNICSTMPHLAHRSPAEREDWLRLWESTDHNASTVCGQHLFNLMVPSPPLIQAMHDIDSVIDRPTSADDFLSRFSKPSLSLIRSFWTVDRSSVRVRDVPRGCTHVQLSSSGPTTTYAVTLDPDARGSRSTVYISGASNTGRTVQSPNQYRMLSAGVLKSLLQKVIRYRPVKIVDELGREEDADKCAEEVFRALCEHPGCFVPTIQRFVTGRESAFKRLGVILIEDTYASAEDVTFLFGTALLCQRVIHWRPSLDIVDRAVRIVRSAVSNGDFFKPERKRLRLDASPYAVPAKLLRTLRSFEGDMLLAESVGSAKISQCCGARPLKMPLWHAMDAHCCPEIAFVMSGESTPSDKLKRIWEESSSLNSRKMKCQKVPADIRDAQLRAWKIITEAARLSPVDPNPQGPLNSQESLYTLTGTLENDWVGAMLGPVGVKVGNKEYLAILDKALEWRVVAKPSRGNIEAAATPNTKATVITAVLKRLRGEGIAFGACDVPSFNRARLLERDGLLMIKTGTGELLRVDEALSKPIHFPQFRSGDTVPVHGVAEDADAQWQQLLDASKLEVKQRLLFVLRLATDRIRVPSPGLRGTGIDIAPSRHDSQVWLLLEKLSMLFPSAIQRVKGGWTFIVCNAPLFFNIQSRIPLPILCGEWPSIRDTKERTLTPAQQAATAAIRDSGAGAFLWMTVGMGKTLVCLETIRWLIETSSMPRYAVYSLPVSALSSVVAELQLFGVEMEVLCPLNKCTVVVPRGVQIRCKAGKGIPHPRPFVVSLILSDNHLRYFTDTLVGIASSLFFIIDEVHTSMNDTLRSSTALNTAACASRFLAFTGTPIVDEKVYKLRRWLSLIVDFPLTDSNFMVATQRIVAEVETPPQPSTDAEVVAQFLPDEWDEYCRLVPEACGGTNTYATSADFRAAITKCYTTCDREMVNLVRRHLRKGVVLVARDMGHAERLASMCAGAGLEPFLMRQTMHHTDESVADGSPDYRLVIVPQQRCAGYSLTRLSVMISGVYPSNEANRTQMRGRINRLGQSRPVNYLIVHCGVLTSLYEKHSSARSLEAMCLELSRGQATA